MLSSLGDCEGAAWKELPSTTGRLWEVECASGTLILKRYRNSISLQYELEALRLIESSGLLVVPEVVRVDGAERSVAVAKVDGVRLSQILTSKRLPQARREAVAWSLGRSLQFLHRIPGTASRVLPQENLRAKLERELLRLQSYLGGGLGEALELPLRGHRGTYGGGRLLQTEGEVGLFILKLRRLTSALARRDDERDLVLTHGDLWSGNVLLPNSTPDEARLLDFEHASFSSRVFDLATVFMRGLSPRAPNEPYRVTPLKGLWPSFLRGYGEEAVALGNRTEFLCAEAAYLLRTFNHYAEYSMAKETFGERIEPRRACLRIGGAMVGLCAAV